MLSPSSDPELPRKQFKESRVKIFLAQVARIPADHRCSHMPDWISESARVRETLVSSFRVRSKFVDLVEALRFVHHQVPESI